MQGPGLELLAPEPFAQPDASLEQILSDCLWNEWDPNKSSKTRQPGQLGSFSHSPRCPHALSNPFRVVSAVSGTTHLLRSPILEAPELPSVPPTQQLLTHPSLCLLDSFCLTPASSRPQFLCTLLQEAIADPQAGSGALSVLSHPSPAHWSLDWGHVCLSLSLDCELMRAGLGMPWFLSCPQQY